MRSKKAFINAIYGMAGYIILMLSNLITRSVLVKALGYDLAGLDTVFKNFLSFLSLAELGIGTGLIYKLYTPILQDDKKQIKRILNFYKNAYIIISLVFLLGSVIVACFTKTVIKENYSALYLGVLFMLYAGDTVASYLYANRKALIIADQRNYLVSRNDAFISIFSFILQVSFLFLIKGNPFLSFIIYAAIKIICRLSGAVFIGYKFKKLYPEIYNDKSKEVISGEEREGLLQNIGALLMHRVGAVSVTATGSAFVSALIDLKTAGIYGNYILIITTLNMMLAQIYNGIVASFGQFSNSESKEKVYEKFKVLYFANFLLMAFFCTAYATVIQPFISVWIGKDGKFPITTIFLLTIYLFVSGIRRCILMAKDAAGLYRPDRYLALLEAGINIALSFIFIKLWGVNGLILANTASMLIVPLWSQPYLVYKYVVENLKGLKFYYLKYIIYFAITLAEVYLTYKISLCIPIADADAYLQIIINAFLALIIPNVINFVLFFRTSEMKELFKMAKSILKSSEE